MSKTKGRKQKKKSQANISITTLIIGLVTSIINLVTAILVITNK
ncbi:TPA: hypothetical protein ACG3R3_002741 [Clostridioides difficile]